MTVIMLAASIAPGYDFDAAAISNLGVVPETALLFNTSLLAVGALSIVGGYLFYRSHRKAWVLALYVIAGIGAAGAGAIPLGTSGLHSVFASSRSSSSTWWRSRPARSLAGRCAGSRSWPASSGSSSSC